MDNERILSIDYGTKKIGLAISDEDLAFALKLPILYVDTNTNLIEKINEVLEKNGTNIILIGYPLNSDFEKTKICFEIDEFIESLEKNNDSLKIVKINETLTSKQAKINHHYSKFKSKHLDSEAARIMLQEYLDHKIN
ncbi:MAG: Holliday junction resolvase RuvX [Candidatus Dojkabacteria bacterium]|nr:Holliday junction resolvase RuvX [Candidatus Dojkabacteria bacterium]MDQ7020381.1 Holliday junction resolvase RuvX [Candidatus Dojkabacteria bacterium]